jgi:hypothetical protein
MGPEIKKKNMLTKAKCNFLDWTLLYLYPSVSVHLLSNFC